MVKPRRERKKEEEEMASLPPPAPMPMAGAVDSSSRPIPLVCSVCPSTPSFSDSSHLLTHIASKGHLHHETQTKLRAHQDLTAMYALQQYEQWYRDNNIETLLVERLKAKQDKEAARVRRGRGNPSAGPVGRQTRKKPRRSMSVSTTIKTEQDEFGPGFPSMFPQFGQSDLDSEFVDDFLSFPDMSMGETMLLKGQIYPGMGKMDLANDEMKRTRNQRKPKSVVDKMRRTSEGIKSTQVVLTPNFEVERVKDVYDDDSPAEEDDEQSPPRKATRTRRKKAQPLVNLSTNVPRMTNGSVSRETSTCSGPASKPNIRPNQYMGPTVATPLGPLRQSFDVFRDEDPKSAFETVAMAPHMKRESRFGDQYAMHALNPIPHSNVSSPSPSMRDIPPGVAQDKDTARPRFQAHPYYAGGHLPFNSFVRGEDEYGMNDSAMYQNSVRLPYGTAAYDGTTRDQYRMHLPIPPAIKQDQYSSGLGGDALGDNEHNLFLNFPHTSPNPLLSQNRVFLNPYQQGSAPQPGSPLGFTSINRSREYAYTTSHGHDLGHETPSHIKLEPQTHQTLGSDHSSDGREHLFDPKVVWREQGSEDDMPIQDEIKCAPSA